MGNVPELRSEARTRLQVETATENEGRCKRLGILLFTTPYGSENTDTAIKIAQAALNKGYEVTIFAYGDSVHNFTKGQRPSGITNAEKEFQILISKGLKVELCGTCLAFRGIDEDMMIKEATPSSMRNLCKIMDDADTFISFT